MSDPFIGQIMTVGFNFAPRGWALCDGQLLQIAQYSALFSLLGTTYGGDGRTTFGLPDLRGRVIVHPGTGPGLPTKNWGQKAGSPTATLNVANLPPHNHTAQATNNLTLLASPATATEEEASDNSFGNAIVYSDADPSEEMRAGSIGGNVAITVNNTGSSAPFSIEQPSLGVYYVIALQGIYPSRN